MLLVSSNTGSTDLRLTDVQQPNTAATFCTVISSRAFSANSGQLLAGSTTTASSLRPSTPPFLFCSSISMSITSFNVVSLMAIVPDRLCRMPILTGSVCAIAGAARPAMAAAARLAPRSQFRMELMSTVLPDTRHPSQHSCRPGPTTLAHENVILGCPFGTRVPGIGQLCYQPSARRPIATIPATDPARCHASQCIARVPVARLSL